MPNIPAIYEYTVVQPPTSEEVRHATFAALETNDCLELAVLGQHEVPAPAEEPLRVRILRTVHPEAPDETGMIVAGRTAEGNSVVITLSKDLGSPAVASVVKP